MAITLYCTSKENTFNIGIGTFQEEFIKKVKHFQYI